MNFDERIRVHILQSCFILFKTKKLVLCHFGVAENLTKFFYLLRMYICIYFLYLSYIYYILYLYLNDILKEIIIIELFP